MIQKRPVIAFFTHSLLGEYHITQLLAINEAAQKLDFSLCVFCPFLFYSQTNYQKEYLQTFELANPDHFDGLIVSGAPLSYFFDDATLSHLFEAWSNKPVVNISRGYGVGLTVEIDNDHGFYALTEHLVRDHGYRSLWFVSGPPKNADSAVREKAFYRCLSDHGIAAESVRHYAGDFGYSSGQLAIRDFFKTGEKLPEVIVCANDDMALGALSELEANGFRVPRDLALVGYDDIVGETFSPGLTSVNQGLVSQVEVAVDRLIDLIEGRHVNRSLRIEPRLVRRASCGCTEGLEPTESLLSSEPIRRIAGQISIKKGYSLGELTTFAKGINDALTLEALQNSLAILVDSMALTNLFIAIYPGSIEGQVVGLGLPKYAQILFRKGQKGSIEKPAFVETKGLGLSGDELRAQRSTRVISEFIHQNYHFGFCSLELNKPDAVFVHMINLEICNLLRALQIKYKMDEAIHRLKEMDVVKNEFIANIAHDFRSSLSIMLGASELGLLDHQVDSEDHKRYELISDASLQLKNIIDRFLDLSKLDGRAMTIQAGEYDLRQFLQGLVEFYQSSLFSSGIKIDLGLDPSIESLVFIDIEKLEQILHNLVSNAIKFVDIQRGIISVAASQDSENLVIEVSDNGIGIESGNLEYIFERFSQVKTQGGRNPGGTGIGLAFCRQLANLMGGKVWAVSEGLGRGSKFTVQLPVQNSASQGSKTQSSLSPSQSGRDEFKALIKAHVLDRTKLNRPR